MVMLAMPGDPSWLICIKPKITESLIAQPKHAVKHAAFAKMAALVQTLHNLMVQSESIRHKWLPVAAMLLLYKPQTTVNSTYHPVFVVPSAWHPTHAC